MPSHFSNIGFEIASSPREPIGAGGDIENGASPLLVDLPDDRTNDAQQLPVIGGIVGGTCWMSARVFG